MIEKKADNIEYCDEKWMNQVIEQENRLRFEGFSRIDALKLGNLICETAVRKYGAPVAVKVMMDGITAFSHFMGDTGLKNEWWMSCKYNTVLKTKTSSLRALLEFSTGRRKWDTWCRQTNSYYLCGGAFPLHYINGDMFGCVLVSGLTHEEDHQLIVDALSGMLNADVPVIVKERE